MRLPGAGLVGEQERRADLDDLRACRERCGNVARCGDTTGGDHRESSAGLDLAHQIGQRPGVWCAVLVEDPPMASGGCGLHDKAIGRQLGGQPGLVHAGDSQQ